MGPRRRGLLVAAVGFLLLLVPMYAPAGAPHQKTVAFRAEEVSADRALEDSEDLDLTECESNYSPACNWLRRAGPNGTVAVDVGGTADPDARAEIFSDEYFALSGEYATGNATVSGETMTVRFSRVPQRALVRNVTEPLDSVDPLVRAAVLNGTAETRTRIWGREVDWPVYNRYVRHDGQIYRVELTQFTTEPELSPRLYRNLKLLTGLFGLVLIWVGRGWHARAPPAESHETSDAGWDWP